MNTPHRTLLLHHLVDRTAHQLPQRPAVSTNDTTMTYRQLAETSVALAGWLRGRGVGRGDRVVVSGPSQPMVAALFYASSRVGAAFVPLHEQVRGTQLDHVLADAEPALVIGADNSARQSCTAAGVPYTDLDAIPLAPPEQLPAPPPEPLPVDPLCLIYTSGTTSMPKAVVSTHQQVLFAADAIQSRLEYRDGDVVYSPLPLSFDYGLYQLFLGALSGAHVWLGSPAEAGPPLLRNVRRTGATVLPAVPAVAEALATLLTRPDQPAPNLRLITNTGAAMSTTVLAQLRHAMPSLRVQLMFGLTECKRATIMPPDGDLERPGACGRALPGTEVFVVDEDGRRLEPGTIGEIVVRGPNVMSGYWRRPEETAHRFPQAEGLFPRLHTGDFGSLDADGYLYFAGRRDDIYKERGFRVSTLEVEAAARRVPGVHSAAVLPPEQSRPAVLIAATDLDGASVLRGLRHQIEQFKIPRRCVAVSDLPLTRNGKVDRDSLGALVKEADDA